MSLDGFCANRSYTYDRPGDCVYKMPGNGSAALKKAHLSRKQEAFIREYDAANGNGTQAAKRAGYAGNANVLGATASRLLRKDKVKSELARIDAQIGVDYGPNRVKRRLHEISHSSERAGQFGPAVRSEELLGKAAGMWVEQTINLQGQLKDEHIQALLELARKRQVETSDK